VLDGVLNCAVYCVSRDFDLEFCRRFWKF
jgi:hypothetical protein